MIGHHLVLRAGAFFQKVVYVGDIVLATKWIEFSDGNKIHSILQDIRQLDSNDWKIARVKEELIEVVGTSYEFAVFRFREGNERPWHIKALSNMQQSSLKRNNLLSMIKNLVYEAIHELYNYFNRTFSNDLQIVSFTKQIKVIVQVILGVS